MCRLVRALRGRGEDEGGVETEGGAVVESRSGLDQNTNWVIVEIPSEMILLRQIV